MKLSERVGIIRIQLLRLPLQIRSVSLFCNLDHTVMEIAQSSQHQLKCSCCGFPDMLKLREEVETYSFPVFSPVNNIGNASGAFSNPSTMWSFLFMEPSASAAAISLIATSYCDL